MRGAWAGFLLVLLASSAQAQGTGEAKVDPGSLSYFSDGRGHYIAVDLDSGTMFYSNHKGPFYRLRSGPGSSADSEHKEWSFWSPQARGPSDVSVWQPLAGRGGALTVYLKPRRADVRCARRHTRMMPVDSRTAAKLRKKPFKLPRHDRTVLFFARDDNAQYYLADERMESRGGGDMRFYFGKLGRAKEMRLTEVVHDEVGDLFVGREGRFVNSRVKKEMTWHPRGGQAVEVFPLDPSRNDFIIYGSLGVYKDRLGTPCDDL